MNHRLLSMVMDAGLERQEKRVHFLFLSPDPFAKDLWPMLFGLQCSFFFRVQIFMGRGGADG